jgi:spoIIIJ-associated protein
VAHAEASARTVDAAVAAAATQLGLRPDQVDIEVLEDPVPSTFGYIGTPARVRVTSRGEASPPGSPSTDEAASGGPTSPGSPSSAEAASGVGSGPAVAPAADAADAPAATASGAAAAAGATAPAEIGGSSDAQAPAGTADGAAAADLGADRQASAPPDASNASPSQATQVATPSLTATPTTIPASTATPAAGSDLAPSPDPVLSSPPRPDSERASISPPDPDAESTPGRLADAIATTKNDPDGLNRTISSESSDHPDSSSISGADSGSVAEAGSVADAGIDEPTPPTGVPVAAAARGTSGIPTAQPSSTLGTGGNGGRASDGEAARATSTIPESSSATRPPRRTYRDEPIEPAMVEADTERAGDFLEGLLDALDVDGDITTWVDEVGGHIDLEGSELDVLVGSNGETLDALQELTRLAVLRQSKRRVRLLLDINGFRARQREQLVSVVKATAEQVIRTREDHEFQPMTPAERKIVHDAVAAIDGARTESLGEDPHRRVVIRPA